MGVEAIDHKEEVQSSQHRALRQTHLEGSPSTKGPIELHPGPPALMEALNPHNQANWNSLLGSGPERKC